MIIVDTKMNRNIVDGAVDAVEEMRNSEDLYPC